MGEWLAALGPVEPARLCSVLGEGAVVSTVTGAALGVRRGAADGATLQRRVDGTLQVQTGGPGEDAAPVTLAADGASLTIRCDPFGLRGAYHARVGETRWCASDPRLLAALPGVDRSLAPAALHGYLTFSYVPTPYTMFRGVHALPAGATATVRAEGIGVRAPDGWREEAPAGRPRGASDRSPPRSEDAAVRDLRDLLGSAVARRLAGVRRVGVFLSGGLDSSLVAALLVRLGVEVRCFTLDFGPPFDDEVAYARAVARHLGRPLDLVPAGVREVKAALDATAAALQQPFGDAVTVPLYLLGRAARGVDAVFNGEGGDQLFGGWTNKPMVAAEVYAASDYEREAAYMETFHRFHGLTDALYTEATRAAVAGWEAAACVRPALDAPGFRSLLHRLRAANLTLKGAQNIAPRAVQLGAVHGLSVRMPFFDRALTAWTFRLPPEWFLRGACEKYLFKRAAECYLPAEVVWREKRGMGVPVTEWLRGPLRREAGRRLSARRVRRDGLFEPAAVKALLRGEDHAGEIRRRRLGERLWTLLMFQAWSAAVGLRRAGLG